MSAAERGAALREPSGAARTLEPIPMNEAVGYPQIGCEHQNPVENALVLKHDRLFLAVDAHGDIMPPGSCSLGLFHDDTRILSHSALRVLGGPPSLLSSQVPRTYVGQVDLAVEDAAFGGDSWDPQNAIHIRRELLLDDRLIERVTLTNYLNTPLDYWMELSLSCDFADIFEVRGWRRAARGTFYAPHATADTLTFLYRGRDGLLLQSMVQFETPPDELNPRGARWQFRLEPNGQFQTEWQVTTGDSPPPRVTSVGGLLGERRDRLESLNQEWRARCSHWSTDVAEFDLTIARAVDDLHALYTHVGSAPVITGGIPWYSTIFGRDSIITSLQTLCLNPTIARDTLRYLAASQGERVDPFTEEQPGKIMHELRRGEMARSGEIPHIPYYGTVDATPLWLVLLYEVWRWTGDGELIRELLPNAERALAWIDAYGDLDGDGLVEYASTSAKGLSNQGWKDSSRGVPLPDGTLPEPPIALVEVQGYVYDAKLRLANLFRIFGDTERAERLRREARQLRDRIIEAFWLESEGTFALALDGGKQPVPTATSNAGHLLWSRVARPEHAARLASVLLGPDFFSGWGIRTLSATHPVFNPMSYHNGSVWPHDNAILILGLSFYAHTAGTLPVIRALHEAAAHTDFQRLPELFAGMQRAHGMRPVLYPVSCSPQAWASGAFFMLLQAVLGIFPEAPQRILHIRNPILPDFLDELTVTDLAIGGSRVSLHFRRHGTRTLANLLSVEGDPIQVRIELG